jgi:hypothetical protein
MNISMQVTVSRLLIISPVLEKILGGFSQAFRDSFLSKEPFHSAEIDFASFDVPVLRLGDSHGHIISPCIRSEFDRETSLEQLNEQWITRG